MYLNSKKNKFSLNIFSIAGIICFALALVFLCTNYIFKKESLQTTLENNTWEMKKTSPIEIVYTVTFSKEEVNLSAANLGSAFSGYQNYQYVINENILTIATYEGEEVYSIKENESGFEFTAKNELAKTNRGNLQLVKKNRWQLFP
ncbi:hypothetical protein [Enterococcus sp. LJL51]|uniref:hypothetical protein n=1 Tax=Enterococcus sp. LJL51 TaxID=3416656 RepID=UPI003CF8D7CF